VVYDYSDKTKQKPNRFNTIALKLLASKAKIEAAWFDKRAK
jgi:hypothetical protein